MWTHLRKQTFQEDPSFSWVNDRRREIFSREWDDLYIKRTTYYWRIFKHTQNHSPCSSLLLLLRIQIVFCCVFSYQENLLISIQFSMKKSKPWMIEMRETRIWIVFQTSHCLYNKKTTTNLWISKSSKTKKITNTLECLLTKKML